MAKIKLNTKEEFFAYAKKVLKEEILRLQEAKAEEKIKAKQLPVDDTTPEQEMKRLDKKQKQADVRNELESSDAVWTNAGFEKRQPTPPTSKLKDPKTPEFADVYPKGGKARDLSVHMKDLPVKDDEEDPKLGVEKRGKGIEGFDRTAAQRKAEPLRVDVADAPEYTEERGYRNLRDYKNYLGRMLLTPSVGFDKKNHRMLVSATNTETGEVEDSMLEDLSAEALINLAMQNPSLLNPKTGSFEAFLKDVRGNTPVADMYDPEMDRDKFTFELGDIVPGASTKKEKDGYYGKEKDRLDLTQEETADALGISQAEVSNAEISALRKQANMYNNSYMRAAELQSAKLADIVADFMLEYRDQLTIDNVEQFKFAFGEFLRLLITKGMVGQYIKSQVSSGKIGGIKFDADLLTNLYANIEEFDARIKEIQGNPKLVNPKSKFDKTLLLFAKQPAVVELMIEEYNGLVDLFEHAAELFLTYGLDEDGNFDYAGFDDEIFRERLTNYIAADAEGLYGHKEKVASKAEPKIHTTPELERDIRSRLRARNREQDALRAQREKAKKNK